MPEAVPVFVDEEGIPVIGPASARSSGARLMEGEHRQVPGGGDEEPKGNADREGAQGPGLFYILNITVGEAGHDAESKALRALGEHGEGGDDGEAEEPAQALVFRGVEGLP